MCRRIVQATVVVAGMAIAGCVTADEENFRQYAVASPSSAMSPSVAEPQNLPTLTAETELADYCLYAALNNPQLEAAFYRWRAAVARIPQARSLPDPQLTYHYYLNHMGMGPQMQRRQMLGISQGIPWPGKLTAMAAIVSQEADAAFQRFQAERLKLFQQITRAYYEYYYLARAIAVTEENHRLVEYLEGVARTRYKAAAGSHPDVIRAQVELGKLANRLATLRDMRSARAAKLNASLNRPVDAPLPLPQTIQLATLDQDTAQLLERLTKDNPHLRAAAHAVAARDYGVDLAEAGFLPDFMVGVDWMDMTERPGATMSAEDNWGFMVGMTLPIWMDKNTAAVREARARRRAAELDRTNMTNTLQAELTLTAYEYRDAMRRVSLYRDTLLPRARQSFGATEAAYKTGRATFSDLVDSQRVWLEFQLAYERSLVDSQEHLADVRALVGQVDAMMHPAPPQATPSGRNATDASPPPAGPAGEGREDSP